LVFGFVKGFGTNLEETFGLSFASNHFNFGLTLHH